MKELLFVYGTLKTHFIQKAVFGRAIPGDPDILEGYKSSGFRVGDLICPVIVPDNHSFVSGLVLAVTSKELELIDKYETDVYTRIKVFLKSGKRTWVYVENLDVNTTEISRYKGENSI